MWYQRSNFQVPPNTVHLFSDCYLMQREGFNTSWHGCIWAAFYGLIKSFCSNEWKTSTILNDFENVSLLLWISKIIVLPSTTSSPQILCIIRHTAAAALILSYFVQPTISDVHFITYTVSNIFTNAVVSETVCIYMLGIYIFIRQWFLSYNLMCIVSSNVIWHL